MSTAFSDVPRGSGKHPIALVVMSANDLAGSSAFYSRLFGWRSQPMSPELAVIMPPAGPLTALRSNVPEGSQGLVPYIGVSDVEAMLARVVAAGGTVERAPWSLPMVGKLARFMDPAGTVYGLTDAASPAGAPHVPLPFGSSPKPPAGAICSLEMYAVDSRSEALFGALFGWSTLATMPQYTAFDAGAGVGGVFQSHTPSLPALAYIYVADIDATLAAIDGSRGQRLGESMRAPGLASFGYFRDPSGTTVGLIGP